MELTKEHEQELYLEHEGYIAKIVEKMLKLNETFRYLKEDIKCECALKFVELVRRYEVRPDCKFSSYLYFRIRGTCHDIIRQEAKIKMGEEAFAEWYSEAGPRFYELSRFEELITEGNLTDNQADVIRLKYRVGMTTTEIAEKLGISQQAVHRTEQRALGTLKYSLENLCDFK